MTHSFTLSLTEPRVEFENYSTGYMLYYRKSTRKLIVCASKVGTTFLTKKFTHQTDDISLTITNDTHDVLHSLAPAAERWFIYRDPMERFVSWYDSFVVRRTHQQLAWPLHVLTINMCIDMYSPEKTFEENALQVLKNPRFKEIYIHDNHLVPMSFFFLRNAQNVRDYWIIHTKSLAELLHSKFGKEHTPDDTYHYETVVPDSLNEFRYLWNSDYIFLEPRVRIL